MSKSLFLTQPDFRVYVVYTYTVMSNSPGYTLVTYLSKCNLRSPANPRPLIMYNLNVPFWQKTYTDTDEFITFKRDCIQFR